jgi:hypothetical protein
MLYEQPFVAEFASSVCGKSRPDISLRGPDSVGRKAHSRSLYLRWMQRAYKFARTGN